MNIEELKEWAENIPLEDLWTELRRLTGLADLKFTSNIIERNSVVRINFKSQDLAEKVGFLKLMFSTIVIEQFNSEVFVKQTEDENKSIPMWWGTASFQYTHPSGGSNGVTFLTFWYNDRQGWKFEQRG